MRRYLVEEWEFYSGLIPIIFTYRYTDNDENVRRGRVGRIAGFRQGTRNLQFVPIQFHPVTRNHDLRTRRYFDLGRNAWRSFAVRSNLDVTITAFWNALTGEYVDSPEEAIFNIDPEIAGAFQERQAEREGSAERSRQQRPFQVARERRRQQRRVERATR